MYLILMSCNKMQINYLKIIQCDFLEFCFRFRLSQLKCTYDKKRELHSRMHPKVGWMFFWWWTILDTHKKLLGMKKTSVMQFLTQTGVPGSYYHSLFKGT